MKNKLTTFVLPRHLGGKGSYVRVRDIRKTWNENIKNARVTRYGHCTLLVGLPFPLHSGTHSGRKLRQLSITVIHIHLTYISMLVAMGGGISGQSVRFSAGRIRKFIMQSFFYRYLTILQL